MPVVIKGRDNLIRGAEKLKEKGKKAVSNAVIRTTNYALKTVVERMTALRLVDTGFARGSWKTSFPNQFTGILSSNCVYIPMLEYGWSTSNGPIKVRQYIRRFKAGTRRAHTRTTIKAGKRKRATKRASAAFSNLLTQLNFHERTVRVKASKYRAFTQVVKAHTRTVNRKGHFFIRYTIIKSFQFFQTVLAEELRKISNGKT